MNLKRRLGALALTLAMLLSLTIPALAAEDTSAEGDAFDAAMTYGGAAMGSYAIWDNGEITVEVTGGPLLDQPERPADPAMTGRNTYGIGSVSKIYTTAAVMKLVEAGRVDLDAPVTTYLKDFKMADSRYRNITVRMLLNHTAGLMGSSQQNALLFGDTDTQATDQLLERLSTQRLKWSPGEIAAYCNDGFTLAELLVEAVSGQDFMDYVRAAILTPLGLKNTYAPQDGFRTDLLAPTYSTLRPDTELPAEYLGMVGAGGLFATAADMASFGGALTEEGVLSEESLSAMAAPEYERGIWPDEPTGLVSFGLGWDAVEFWPFAQNGIQCLVKGGDTLRHHAALLVLPEYNMAAAVLTSGGVSTYNEMAAAQLLAAALEKKGVEIDQTTPALPDAAPAAMPAALTDESGYYGTSTQQVQVTVSADGALTIHQINLADIPDQTLTYYSDGSFRDEGNSVAVKLVKERNGYTYLYQQGYTPIPGLGVASSSDYLLVKMPENKVSAELQAAWDEAGRIETVPLEEKYTSQTYLALSEQAGAAAGYSGENVPGYIQGCRIVDKNTARYELPIGRDAGDIILLTKDLASVSDVLYQMGTLKPLYAGSGWSYATIQEDGRARWFSVGAAAGKTMTVTLPENAGFYVYDGDGALTASSFLWGDSAAELPEDGAVVFAGDPGAQFHLRFTA